MVRLGSRWPAAVWAERSIAARFASQSACSLSAAFVSRTARTWRAAWLAKLENHTSMSMSASPVRRTFSRRSRVRKRVRSVRIMTRTGAPSV